MADIYAYTSNTIYCNYTMSIARSGTTVTLTVSGTIYGNGSSSDTTSGQALYVQVRTGVSPTNTSGTTTYVSNYGTLLNWSSTTTVTGYTGTNSNCMIASNTTSNNLPPLNKTGFPTSGRAFTVTYTTTNGAAVSLDDVALFIFKDKTSTTAPSNGAYTFIGKKSSSISGNKIRYVTQDLSVVAATYTISYNANGHGTAPSSQTKTYGTALTLQSFIANVNGTTNTVTITGNKGTGDAWSGSNGSATWRPVYSQTYWNTASGGTGTNYASAASYTANAAATMYAQWKTTNTGLTYVLPTGTPTKNATTSSSMTVTFNANNGTTTKTSQTSVKTTTYTFKGWFTASSGGTQRTTSSRVTAAETVYAQFNSTTGAQAAVTLPTASQCTRTGYTLLGWSTSSTATTATYNPGASYTPSASIILYAVWSINSYTLTINPNGGTWGGTTGNSTATQNYNTTKSIADPTPPTGFEFVGWAKQGKGKIWNSVNDGGAFDTDNNGVTAYVWNPSGSTASSGSVTRASSTANPLGSGYILNCTATTPSNSDSDGRVGFVQTTTSAASQKYIHLFIANLPIGYKFRIYANATGTGRSYYWLTENRGYGTYHLYAYEIDCGSTGTFNTFGFVGITTNGATVNYSIAYSEIYNITTTNKNFTYQDGAGKIVAQYKPITYNISYNLDGGVMTRGYDFLDTYSGSFTYVVNPTTMLYNNEGYDPVSGTNRNDYFKSDVPVRQGFTFLGWNITGMDSSTHYFWYDGAGQTTTATTFNTSTISNINPDRRRLRAVSGTVTFTALWSRNNYTITFNANGGSVSEASRSVAYASQITNLPTPTRSGYSFKGWSLRFDGTSSTAVNYGRSFMFTNLLSVHFDAFSDSWSSSIGRLISCTESGGFNIENATGNCPAFAAYDTSAYKYAIASIQWSDLNPTVWHSFDLIFDGSSIVFYIDGNQEASTAFTNGNVIKYNSSNSIWLGAEAIGTQTEVTTPYFDGEIANVVIKNTSTITPDNTYNSFSMPAQSVTLYAIWEKVPYVVKVYNNGSWVLAPSYIYINGEWKAFSNIKVYNGSSWEDV